MINESPTPIIIPYSIPNKRVEKKVTMSNQKSKLLAFHRNIASLILTKPKTATIIIAAKTVLGK